MRINVFLFLELSWLILIFSIIGGGDVVAQSITDSVFQVPDVVIRAPRSEHFRNDIKTDVFSGDELSEYAGESLSRFLTSNTALNIKTYGTGGSLASISLRGTSSSHVQVNWHGVPINSTTVGSFDFSIVPADGFDKVSVVYGASGALYGSGTFGGAINLDSNLKPGKALNGSAHVSYQSLKTINGSASFLIGNDKLVWRVNAWGANSDNEFTYYDYIKQCRRKQTDGDWHDAGIIQDAVLKLTPSSTLEAGLWYQFKANNIPSRIGSTSYESQKDSTFKLYLAYKTLGNRWGLQVKAAMFNDEQGYWQKASGQSGINSIESDISARQWYSDANFRYFILPYLSVDAGVIGTYITADVSAYGTLKEEKGLAAFAGLKYDKRRLSWQTAVRKEWNSNFSSGILPSFGIAWKIVPDNWILRANVSQKFRKPTFNDLYWVPGGTSGLKPEMGYSVETGSSATVWKNQKTKISTDLSIYWSQIKDMIVWRPAGTYWEAKNYQRVHSAGIDAKLMFDTEQQRWKYHSSLMITLNRSMVKVNTDDQETLMIYSPRVITAWENQFTMGIIDLTVWHHFSADRFYDDNALLDPYQTIDLRTGVRIPVGKGTLGIHISCHNLTDTEYELIRLYPMPGRYWSVKMNYAF
ncbi:MAG: TonB-dependent receptor plug domain-containing protein [Bacteroidales bacterium]|nr:TonB-dependent receptor plug domain-containing protein [Bacteroidales bacterium]